MSSFPTGSYYLPGSSTGGFQQIEYSFPSIYTADQYLANADYLFNSKNTLAMRYFFTEDPQQSPFSISNIPGTPCQQLLRQHGFVGEVDYADH